MNKLEEDRKQLLAREKAYEEERKAAEARLAEEKRVKEEQREEQLNQPMTAGDRLALERKMQEEKKVSVRALCLAAVFGSCLCTACCAEARLDRFKAVPSLVLR